MKIIGDYYIDQPIITEDDLSCFLDKETGGTISGNVSIVGPFSCGNAVSAVGLNAVATGDQSLASGMTSRAEGYKTIAGEENSYASGNQTSALGRTSRAVGYMTVASADNAVAFGNQTSALSGESLAGGYKAIAAGNRSASFGFETSALADCTIALGRKACAQSDRSFCWSGLDSKKQDGGVGTFNIYPENGIDGFFVGGKSFRNCTATALSGVLSGQTMDGDPSLEEIASVVKAMFKAFGGKIEENLGPSIPGVGDNVGPGGTNS